LGADVIFLGKVTFTNDDGSGRFTQSTLVRFDVQESFKGVASSVRQIWVDPGSFTSCYENYEAGQRYLIFAYRSQALNDSATMSIHNGQGKNKPLPEDFDRSKPPTVYYAPECAGSRPVDGFPNLDQDLTMLRAYRGGAISPQVLGRVVLYPFRGWPALTGPKLRGVKVTILNDSSTFSVTTDETGEFSLQHAAPGYYKVWADLAPFRSSGHSILHVPETGCGYTDVQLTTTSTLQGIVLDRGGRPANKIPVQVQPKDEVNSYSLHTETDENGQFTITGLPEAEVYLSAGVEYPTTNSPYRRIYYPAASSRDNGLVLRLTPGEHRQSMVLWLDSPLEKASIKVRVVRKERGTPCWEARVRAFEDDRVQEVAETDARGFATVPCLRGLQYKLEAQWLRQLLPVPGILLASARVPFTCGSPAETIELVLDRASHW
jgi:hypothetical protein